MVCALALVACSSGTFSNVGTNLDGRGAAPAQPAAEAPVPRAQPERKLTYSADVELRAKDPWTIAEQARRIATDLDGELLTMAQTGQGDSRSARLTMRVPAARFDEALASLRKLDAEVMAQTIDTKDVTEQFVDLRARLSSKQSEEAQYRSLLTQARTVDDSVKIAQALARVRGEIEQLQGQLSSLTGRIDYSRISVSITNVADITTASAWQPARTAAQALVFLVSLLKFLGDAVIWLVIVGWVPLLLLLGIGRFRIWYDRRFRPSTPPAPTPPPT